MTRLMMPADTGPSQFKLTKWLDSARNYKDNMRMWPAGIESKSERSFIVSRELPRNVLKHFLKSALLF